MKTTALVLLFVLSSAIARSQYTSAIVNSYSLGESITFINPSSSQYETRFAGLLQGRLTDSVAGPSVSFYFLDLRIPSDFTLPRADYFDDIVSGGIDPHACWIIKNYYPGAAGPGQLDNLKKESSAVQLAIWHFTDGLQLQTVQDTVIRNRAIAIAGNASLNGSTVLRTVEFIPDIEPEYFYVKTLGDNGSPVAIDSIDLYYDSGILNTYMVSTTLPDGLSERIEVVFGATGYIKAHSKEFVFPKGSIFRNESDDFPRIFLATPAYGERYFEFDWGTLPVELSSFSSTVSGNDVSLVWTTAFEINNSHFTVERKSEAESWVEIAVLHGSGTSNVPRQYAYADKDLPRGKYEYRLRQFDYNGHSEIFNLDGSITIEAGPDFYLSQNFPNPFNPSTKIEFALSKYGYVNVTIYDLTGKKVAEPLNEFRSEGVHEIVFDAQYFGLASGVYVYALNSDTYRDVKIMMLMK